MPNEWTFTADVAKWAEAILVGRPDLPFGRVEVEERGRGTRKRRDLTIYDRSERPVVTGEIKMPDSPEGGSPLRESIVLDAHGKANRLGVEYFFTWNVNRCVIWKTFQRGKPITERNLEHHAVFADPPLRHSDEVANPRVEEQIQAFLVHLLERLDAIISGKKPIADMPLDAKFLFVWESALEQPVALTHRAITELYEKDKRFTAQLDKWMRESQGWIISHRNEGVIRDNLERAAKFSCYMLATKIIFYKALRRRFPKLRALRIPKEFETGEELGTYLEQRFADAKRITHDYETVFDGDFGDALPFLNDGATRSWRDLSSDTDRFDFTQIDYEIIGQVFERMLSTEERHRFGQHYTRSEVVDLINAFCIRKPEAVVLDPACGGGTFLVRAYGRKKALSEGKLAHQDILRQLYGIDISAYPVHLTTMNLVTRDLIDRANYPLVVRADFFDVEAGKPVFVVPFGGPRGQAALEPLGQVDAIVGNPPYVEQRKIGQYYGKGYKARLQALVQTDCPGAELSARSDIHCYFFTHGLSFLKEDGYIGLLTSSTWLDTGYGFRLQAFLLDNFEIVAVFESNCEPWFTGARVTTAAVILRHQPDAVKRAVNRTRFCLLTKPLTELLEKCTTEEERRTFFDDLRGRVETLEGTEEFTITPLDGVPCRIDQGHLDGLRVRMVQQADMVRLGKQPLGVIDEDEAEENEENADWHEEMAAVPPLDTGEYTGFKWGILLRAPGIFFKLLRKGGTAFVPLDHVAEVKRGITSGCDRFFFVQDVTDDVVGRTPVATGFRNRYGISRAEADRGKLRIVYAGDKSQHIVEARYLAPIVFNLMEIPTVQVDPMRLKKRVLLVPRSKEQLRGTHVLKYIRWGEREGFDERPSVASRNPWYDLTGRQAGDVLWTKTHRYRHVAAANPDGFLANCNLYEMWANEDVDPELLSAVLNSTVCAMNKQFFGRMMGGDPLLKTEVVDVKMMLVPDPRLATAPIAARLREALSSMRQRDIGHLVAVDDQGDEPSGDLAMADRQELDDAVLELLGIQSADERREVRAELYREITRLHRSVRRAEKSMQKFRASAARGGGASPKSIAEEIWEEIDTHPEAVTPLDFVTGGPAQAVALPSGKAKLVNDLFDKATVTVDGEHIPLGELPRAELLKAISDCGVHGEIAIPEDAAQCADALDAYEAHVKELNDEFLRLASDYTADEGMQERIARELWKQARHTSHE